VKTGSKKKRGERRDAGVLLIATLLFLPTLTGRADRKGGHYYAIGGEESPIGGLLL